MQLATSFNEIWSLIISKLKDLRDHEGKRPAELARLLQVNRSTIKVWLEGGGGQKTPAADLFRYMDALGIRPSDVFQDSLPNSDNYGFIPKVAAVLSAGNGSLMTEGEIKGFYAFRRDFLTSMGPSGDLVLMDVNGDSMNPTILHGDTVLVDKSLTTISGLRTGNIVAARADDEILIKRFIREPGFVVLKSDNPAYDPIRIEGDLFAEVGGIIGRVKWMARRM